MEDLIEVRIESLKLELYNNANQLIEKINKFIKTNASIQKALSSANRSTLDDKFSLVLNRKMDSEQFDSQKIGLINSHFKNDDNDEGTSKKIRKIEEIVQITCLNFKKF